MNVFALALNLVGTFHDGIELFQCDRDQARMRDPGAIMSIRGFAMLVGSHTCQSLLVGLWIALNRNLCSHATDGVNIAVMTGLNSQ